MRRFLLLTTALLLMTTFRGTATDLVEIRVNGHYFAEPATVMITVAIEPDQANRTLRVEADGDSMFRSTEVPLDGKSEKRLHTVEFKNLPAGQYELRAEVLSATKVRGTALQDLEVTGR
jgi:hypothetical protein